MDSIDAEQLAEQILTATDDLEKTLALSVLIQEVRRQTERAELFRGQCEAAMRALRNYRESKL